MAGFDLTLDNVRTRVASGIGLDNTNGSTEQGLIDSWTNEGILDFLERTKAKVEHATLTLTANVSDYELPLTLPGILIINTITVSTGGQIVPLEPLPIEEIIWRRRYAGAEPVRYYAVQGANLISFYPTPQAADTVDMYYVPVPTLLASGTDLLSSAGIPPQFQYIVVLYAKWKAGEYNNDGESQNGISYMQQYQAEVRKARGRIRRMEGRRRPAAIPGRRSRRRYIPAFPSQDSGVE